MKQLSKEQIHVMLHALGIEYGRNGQRIEPNKRYSPYPTSYRNYYQTSSCVHWDELVDAGYAEFRKRPKSWQDFYFVTQKGKEHLKSLGYKWHEHKWHEHKWHEQKR